MAWHAKETIRSLYAITDPDEAGESIHSLIADMADMADDSMPPEVQSLARTPRRWRNHIVAWHTARVTNGPTEAANNLIKRIKRVGFGFRNYRIRALLYAGRPNWDLLANVAPR